MPERQRLNVVERETGKFTNDLKKMKESEKKLNELKYHEQEYISGKKTKT